MNSILILAAVVLCANATPTDDASAIDKRKAIGGDDFRWPDKRVPYKIDASSEPDRAVILQAIDHWQDNTCIRFERAEDYPRETFATFKKADGCWADLGYQGVDQTISIGEDCKKERKPLQMGTVAHEIGHALGFYHEQVRMDRDDYVVVLTGNMVAGAARLYDPELNTFDYGVPYDLGSLMHYPPDFYAKVDKNSMVTKDPFKNFLIGQRERLSFWDIKLANIMYNCGENCTHVTCDNGGFAVANCSCICPPGFSGGRCQLGSAAPPAPLTCGGNITGPTTIRSPNYPNKYPAGTKCIWKIRARPGRRVQAVFSHFDLHSRTISTDGRLKCISDVFELRALDNIYDGDKYCAGELQGATKVSATRDMVILFSAESEQTGFQARIRFVQPPIE